MEEDIMWEPCIVCLATLLISYDIIWEGLGVAFVKILWVLRFWEKSIPL